MAMFGNVDPRRQQPGGFQGPQRAAAGGFQGGPQVMPGMAPQPGTGGAGFTPPMAGGPGQMDGRMQIPELTGKGFGNLAGMQLPQVSDHRFIQPESAPVGAPAGGMSIADQIKARFMDDSRDRSLSNLGMPENAQQGMDMFSQLINESGGDFSGLLGEIGGTRMMDRFREFIGRENWDAQSGLINIGNGQTLESLKGLNPNPVDPGGGGPGGPGTGGLAPRPGPGGPGGPGGGRGGGGRGGGGGGGKPGFLGFMEQMLRERMGGEFGISQETQDQQRSALNSQGQNMMRSGLSQLEAQMNAAGGLGGGRQGAMGMQMGQQINESILNQLASQQLGFDQMGMQDRQAAFGEGGNFANTLVNQQLGMGDIGARHAGIQSNERLGNQANRTNLEQIRGNLGLGHAQLGQQGSQFGQTFGLNQQNQQFNQGMQSYLLNSGLLGLG